jgi:hypothetical protein
MSRPTTRPREANQEGRTRDTRDPEERRRIGRTAAAGLFATLASISCLGALVVWHLIRRGRILRSLVASPKPGVAPELSSRPADRTSP